MIFFITPVIIAEIYFNISRNRDYEDIPEHESVIFQTDDNVKIQGWYTNSSEILVILVHGHWDHSSLMYERYNDIFSKYDTLYLDLRNHGRSESKNPVTLGVLESRDVNAALNWVSTKSWKKVILWGTSMGAIAGIMSKRDIISGLILDSAFLDHKLVIDLNMQKHHLPAFWRREILWYMDKRIDQFCFPNIIHRFENISQPLLYMHGDADKEAPLSIVEEINALENSMITTKIIPNGEHSLLFENNVYKTYIDNFMEEIL